LGSILPWNIRKLEIFDLKISFRWNTLAEHRIFVTNLSKDLQI
jgi:hypothetical protein